MDFEKGLVSIITPVYNSEKYISTTIDSVIAQTYENWELILIDDGSIDKSVEIINSYIKRDNRISLLRNENNSGPAISRNKGIKAAKGSYLTFIDADDIWMPSFLSISLNFVESNNYNFVFSSYKRVDEDLQSLYNDFIVPERVDYNSLLKTCPISCLTAFIKISSTGKYYMPNIEKRQDYGLWLSILKEVEYAYGIRKPLATYRIRKGSVSRNKFKAILYVWRIYRDVEKIGFLKSLYLILCYTYNGYKKYSN